MKPGPLWGHSPVESIYDGFWARLQEADAKLVFHSTDPRYLAMLGVQFGESATPSMQGQTPFQWYLTAGKPIADTLANYTLNNLFGRFPGLQHRRPRVRHRLGRAAAARHGPRRAHGPQGLLAGR